MRKVAEVIDICCILCKFLINLEGAATTFIKLRFQLFQNILDQVYILTLHAELLTACIGKTHVYTERRLYDNPTYIKR